MASSVPALSRALDGLGRWPRFFVTLLAGAALTLAQAPWGVWPIYLLALPVLVWLWQGRTSWQGAAWTGWAAGFGMMIVGLSWIHEAFLVDAARHGWMIPFAIGGLAGGLALFWAAGFALAHRLTTPQTRRGWHGILALATALTLFELARTYVLTGFPWGLIAYGWLDTPVAQMSALIGPHLLGFATLLMGGMLALSGKGQWPSLVAIGLFGLGWTMGQARLDTPIPEREEPFIVRVVQPNATQREKWTAEGMPVFYNRALDASRGGEYDVILWPETAVPQRIETPAVQVAGLIYAWQDIAQATDGRPALVGARRRVEEPGWANWYNSIALVAEDGRIAAHYDKHSLVPGGEFIPFDRQLSRLGLRGLAAGGTAGGFVPGDGPTTLEIEGLPRALPLICYEAIFPHELRVPDQPRAEWIAVVTNDAWFGTSSGPHQHLAQLRFRSIEQGLPAARAANTGISALIDPRGALLQSLAIGEQGFLEGPLPAAIAAPPYARGGDLPGLVLLLAVSAGLLVIRTRP
ncbi:apolipoprotein N-acyltransferase [Pontivivens insulae]|uniref:Apolipoprotein N-acyltransferase n=1 Tax=Pontivivens insulae TaxID=1639689 RepID=A0A2R8AEL0_9RHOB|nr:apolipoprotein N-acyltransferase [Pontivivens insulae]RED11781.1 apolipoprotein N-acyltransferase [Pontivivens insulae]SPF30538.1 Apolipoprotein N-acyltransferase [Pontivivens insulae]